MSFKFFSLFHPNAVNKHPHSWVIEQICDLWDKFLTLSQWIFFSAILTVFIKESLSPRLTPLVFDKHFGVAMPIQVLLSLALCLPWLNLLWVVDISEGHSANQRSRKNFLSSQSQQSFSLKIPNLLCSSIPPFAD